MTGNASQTATAGAVALAQSDGIVMLQMIFIWRRLALRRFHENRQRFLQRLTRSNILVLFTRLEDSFIPDLVACHTDIIRECWGQAGGIHNREVAVLFAVSHGFYMGGSWTMAFFTTYRHLGEHGTLVTPLSSIDRIRTAAVTGETS